MDQLLDVFDLYADAEPRKVNNFNNKLSSTMDVKLEFDRPEVNRTYLDIMELTLPYIENILNEPKRLIINEEEVVNIEKIRKVAVESIKHLAKNSALIDDVKENGEVQPGRLLKVYKEETINTYENRFIYSLIIRMLVILRKEKERLQSIKNNTAKEYRKLDYIGKSYTGKNKVDMRLIIESSTESQGRSEEAENQLERIKILEKKVVAFTLSNTYQTLDREHVQLVVPPLRKNNVLLKNVNFQYCVKLWDFLIDEFEKVEKKKENIHSEKKYKDRGMAKRYVDDTFLLDYLILQCVEDPAIKESHKKEIIEKLIANVIEKVIDMDVTVSEKQLKDLIARQYTVVKYKKSLSNKEIQEIFKKHINKYMEKISRRL